MKSGGAALLIFLGLIVLWVIVSGKSSCAMGFVSCMFAGGAAANAATPLNANAGAGVPDMAGASFGSYALPKLPTLPNLQTMSAGSW